MTLPGQPNDQPSKYRLGLTLSLALLLHTLILAALTHLLPRQPEETPTTVHFALLQPGDVVSARSEASTSSRAAAPSAAPKPATAEIPQPEVVTRKGPQPKPTIQKPATTRQPDQSETNRSSQRQSSASTPSVQAIKSEESGTGAPIATPKPLDQNSQAQITERPAERDPYVTLLWQHISAELDSRPVRSIHDLKRVRTVRLELFLMDNGTLRQVDTIESSGKPDLDRAARQSALAASPYPEPPESAREKGFRFQVELQFTPRRE